MNLQQLQQRNQELSILNAIAQDLNREVELSQALEATLRQTVHLLQLKTGWIWLMPEQSENPPTAYLAAAYNLPPIFQKKPELLSGWCYCIEKYLTGDLADVANISEITCTRLRDLSEDTEGLRYHASVPLFGRKKKIGILNVVSENTQELSKMQLQLLYTIGDMLSIAIERARLFENSKQLGIVQERNRLAREIHDTLAQGLSAISLKLETVQAFLENGKMEKIEALIQQTLSLTKSNLEEARRSVLDLRATPLQENNLPEAIEKLVKNVARDHHLKGVFESSGQFFQQDIRIELGLYRIAQEALQNIVKHAEAQRFTIKLKYNMSIIQLVIEDDGKGFEATPPTKGFGLVGIAERVHILNGKFNLESKKGTGSRVLIEIPIS